MDQFNGPANRDGAGEHKSKVEEATTGDITTYDRTHHRLGIVHYYQNICLDKSFQEHSHGIFVLPVCMNM